MKNPHALRLIWYSMVALVVVGSLLPADSPILKPVTSLPVGDKFEHSTAYAILAFLPTLHERPRRLIALLIFAGVLGVLLEFGQLYSPGRSYDVHDMIADGIGIALGFVVGLPLRVLLRWRDRGQGESGGR